MPEEITFKTLVRQNFTFIIGLAMVVLNLWLASKLAPLAQDINSLSVRVLAVETELDKHEQTNDKQLEIISADIKIIIQKLGNLEGQLKK